MKGKVIKCVKNVYTVLDQGNKTYECTLKGSERLKKKVNHQFEFWEIFIQKAYHNAKSIS